MILNCKNIFWALLCLLLLACKDQVSAPLAVQFPIDGQMNVEPMTVISAQFNADVLASSVDATSFIVADGDSPVPGEVQYEASTRTATFKPHQRLALLRTYTVKLSVVTQAGEVGPSYNQAYQWQFTTRDAVWSAPEIVTLNAATESSISTARVAFDSDGNALAIWKETDGVLQNGLLRMNLWGSRHHVSTGWEPPTLIEHMDGTIGDYEIGVTPAGDAVAIWTQEEGEQRNVWASLRRKDGLWEEPRLLEAVAGNSFSPQMAIDEDGGVIVVWSRWDWDPSVTDNPFKTQQTDIWVNHYSPVSGWAKAAIIEAAVGSATSLVRTELAADADGNAMVLWGQNHEEGSALFVKQYVKNRGWGEKRLLDFRQLMSGILPEYKLAMSQQGATTVIWTFARNQVSELYSIPYNPDEGWGEVELLASHQQAQGKFGGGIRDIDLGVTKAGHVLVAWLQLSGHRVDFGTQSSIVSVYYSKAEGWGEPLSMASGVINPKLVVGNEGDAFLSWTIWYGGFSYGSYQASRYVSGKGWQAPQTLIAAPHFASMLAISDDGRAMSMWSQNYAPFKEQLMAKYFQ